MKDIFLATQEARDKIALLRARGVRQSTLALEARIHPTRLSEIVNGRQAVRPDDRRILRLCGAIGLTFDAAFAPIKQDPAA